MEDRILEKLIEQQEIIKGMQNNEDSLIKIMKEYENTKIELERLKQLYETDKESWKEQMYELQERIENMKMSYETDAEAKYYDFVNKHESKLQQRIDKAIEYIENKEKELEEIKGYDLLGNDYWHFNMKLLEILKGEDKG